jgi:hypothetical protein
LPATASAATGSGGETSAPRASAAASVTPGISARTADATATIVTITRATASDSIVLRRAQTIGHELRRTEANISGGRKMGRIRLGSSSGGGMPGAIAIAAPSSRTSTGYGNPNLSPTPTSSTVARPSPTITASTTTPEVDTLPFCPGREPF